MPLPAQTVSGAPCGRCVVDCLPDLEVVEWSLGVVEPEHHLCLSRSVDDLELAGSLTVAPRRLHVGDHVQVPDSMAVFSALASA